MKKRLLILFVCALIVCQLTGGVSALAADGTSPVVTSSAAAFATFEEDTAYPPVPAVSDMATGCISYPSGSVGIAITSVDNTHGMWRYTDGAYFYDITGVSETHALLLSETRMVKFIPDSNWYGTATIQYKGWNTASGADLSFGDTTADNAYSQGLVTSTVTVTSVNDKPVISDAQSGKVLEFNGMGDYAKIVGDTHISGSFTIEMWCKWNALNNWSRLFDFGSGYPDSNIWLGMAGTEGRLRFESFEGTNEASRQYITGPVIPTGEWMHVAVVYDSAAHYAYMYINGVLRASDVMGNNLDAVRTNNYFGRSNWADDDYFKGYMHDIRIWSTARTKDDIISNMDKTLKGDEPGLAAYYPANEAAGNLQNIVSGSAFSTAYLYGTTWVDAGGIASVVSTVKDRPASIDLTITDADNADLDIRVTSSDQWLIPNHDLALSGTGAARTLTLTPSPNATGSCTITVSASDGTNETSESFPFIVDNCPAGTVSLNSASYSALETAGSVALTFSRTGGSLGAVSVDYATVDGTAKAGSDYTAASGTITFADGDSAAKQITIPILNDVVGEDDETFTVRLGNAQGGAIIGTREASVTISEPRINAHPHESDNYVTLDWTNGDTSQGYYYMVAKSDDTGTTYQTIPLKSTAKVLNVYPGGGALIPGTDLNSKAMDTSANAKSWMETEGCGKGLISVDCINIADFNDDPSHYLYKQADGSYNYDVVFIGSWDSNNNKDISSGAETLLQDFITAGGGYLGGHDTANGTLASSNLNTLTTANLNLLLGSSIPLYGKADAGTIGVAVIKKGSLVNYPWSLSGLTLDIPSTHSTGQFAMGDVWMNFTGSSLGSGITSFGGYTGTNNFYLTTWNNTAMIQTGHSNGTATEDEKKVLANTLLYLSQISSDTSFDDHTGQDVSPPDSVSKPSVSISVDADKKANIEFSTPADNGNTYVYKLKAIGANDGSETWSSPVSCTVKSGIKGYAIVVDQSAGTVPGDTITATERSYTTDSLSIGTWYAHIRAIDNAGNAGGTIHVQFTVYDTASSVNNNITLDDSAVTAGTAVTITAIGDNEDAASPQTGDERYLPDSWTSTESGKSGDFTLNYGAYTAVYTPSSGGSYTITATFKKQTYNGTAWTDAGGTDTKTAPVSVYTTASAASNSLSADKTVIAAGNTVTLTAMGDRQNAAGAANGDERYIPVSWASAESGKSGSFTLSGGVYTSAYTPSCSGNYTVTATFKKQIFDGASWSYVTGGTDKKTAGITVFTVAKATNNSVSADKTTVSAGGAVTLTAIGDRQSAAGISSGDERYIPAYWVSTESGRSGSFTLNGGAYTSCYTPYSAGSYIITASFQKQCFNGASWTDAGVTDTKEVSITLNAAPAVSPTATATHTHASSSPSYEAGPTATASESAAASASATATVTPAETETDGPTLLPVILPDESGVQYGDITGTLQYSNGAPIAGAEVELHSSPVTTTTDENGFFSFPHVALTKHTLLVSMSGETLSEIPIMFEKSDRFDTTETEQGVNISVTASTATVDITLVIDPASAVQIKSISERRGQDFTLYWCLLLILAVTVAVLITVMIMRRKKGKAVKYTLLV